MTVGTLNTKEVDTHFHTVLCLSFHCSHREPDRKGSSHTVQPKRDIVYHISKHTPDTCDRPLQFHSPKIHLIKNPNDSYVMWKQLTTDMVNTLPPFHLLRHARGYSKTLYLTSKAYIVFDRFFFFGTLSSNVLRQDRSNMSLGKKRIVNCVEKLWPGAPSPRQRCLSCAPDVGYPSHLIPASHASATPRLAALQTHIYFSKELINATKSPLPLSLI